MTYFNRGGDGYRGGTNYGRSGSNTSNNRGSDRPALFDAVCAKCGASCQVPFRPNGRKEVFCSKCFEAVSGQGDRSQREFGSSRSRGGFDDRQMFSAICDECGDNCKIPFEPMTAISPPAGTPLGLQLAAVPKLPPTVLVFKEAIHASTSSARTAFPRWVTTNKPHPNPHSPHCCIHIRIC